MKTVTVEHTAQRTHGLAELHVSKDATDGRIKQPLLRNVRAELLNVHTDEKARLDRVITSSGSKQTMSSGQLIQSFKNNW